MKNIEVRKGLDSSLFMRFFHIYIEFYLYIYISNYIWVQQIYSLLTDRKYICV